MFYSLWIVQLFLSAQAAQAPKITITLEKSEPVPYAVFATEKFAFSLSERYLFYKKDKSYQDLKYKLKEGAHAVFPLENGDVLFATCEGNVYCIRASEAERKISSNTDPFYQVGKINVDNDPESMLGDMYWDKSAKILYVVHRTKGVMRTYELGEETVKNGGQNLLKQLSESPAPTGWGIVKIIDRAYVSKRSSPSIHVIKDQNLIAPLNIVNLGGGKIEKNAGIFGLAHDIKRDVLFTADEKSGQIHAFYIGADKEKWTYISSLKTGPIKGLKWINDKLYAATGGQDKDAKVHVCNLQYENIPEKASSAQKQNTVTPQKAGTIQKNGNTSQEDKSKQSTKLGSNSTGTVPKEADKSQSSQSNTNATISSSNKAENGKISQEAKPSSNITGNKQNSDSKTSTKLGSNSIGTVPKEADKSQLPQSNISSNTSQNNKSIKVSPQGQETSSQKDKQKNTPTTPQPTSQNSKVSADSKTNDLANIKNSSNSSMGATNSSRDILASKSLTQQTESSLSAQTPHSNTKPTTSQDDKNIKKTLEESKKIISSMKAKAKEAQDAFQGLQNKNTQDTKQHMDQIKKVERLIIIAVRVIQVDYLSLEKVLSPYKNTYQNLLSEAHSLVNDTKKLKNDIKAMLKKADEALIKTLTPEEKKKKMNENLEKIKTQQTLIDKQLQLQSVSKTSSENTESQPTSQASSGKTAIQSGNATSQASSDKTVTLSGNATSQPVISSQASSDKTVAQSEINAESQKNVQNESGISSQVSSGDVVHQPNLLMENKKFAIIQSESEEMKDIIAECQMLANESVDLKNLLESQNDVILVAQKTLKSSENFIQEVEKKISEQIMNNTNQKNEGSDAINSGLKGIHQAHINDQPIILSN